MTITLLFDPAEEVTVREKIVPLFGERLLHSIPYNPANPAALPAWEEDEVVVTYLDDASLATLVPEAMARKWSLGLLPHPGMVQARLGFGIAWWLKEAVADVLQSEEGTLVDLLFCNGRPVFNAVVIGDAFTLAPGSVPVEGLWTRLLRFLRRLRGLGSLRLCPFTLTTQKRKTLDTAALGIVVVEHGRSSVLSRRIIEDSNIDDGMLHALVLAPRSIMEMIRFLLTSLLLRRRGGGNLPPFVGLIKTESLTVTSPQPMEFSQDDALMSAQQIELTVLPRTLCLIPGRHLSLEKRALQAKENFKIQALPVGKAKAELVGRPLPWIYRAAREEFEELYLTLRENARASPSYLTLMVLSPLLATLGLFANSAAVIIGAMILAPLMAPIISFAMGVVRQDDQMGTQSAKTLALGLLLAISCATALTWAIPLPSVINSEIAARLKPTLLDLGVAVFSGIAGAYAHAREEVAKGLAGVAIAVALVPPLAVSGIGIGWGEWPVFWGASLLFLTNLAGMILAASLTFLFLGFAPFHLARRGLLSSVALVGVVSVPLAFGFIRMVEEYRIVQALEGWEIGGITVRETTIRRREPLHLSVRLLSPTSIDDIALDEVKTAIEARIGRPVVLEAAMGVVR